MQEYGLEPMQAIRRIQAREAIIEHRRTMKGVRRFVAANKASIDAEWDALPNPPRTLAGHQAEVRQRNPKLFDAGEVS
jgi:hypothetical protein